MRMNFSKSAETECIVSFLKLGSYFVFLQSITLDVKVILCFRILFFFVLLLFMFFSNALE